MIPRDSERQGEAFRRARSSLRFALLLASALGSGGAWAHAPQSPRHPDRQLAEHFRDPPPSARPRVWWHWMNGNITKDGIAKDLAWMKREGIGGAQAFDVDLQTPQIVARRLVYMTPEWQQAFRFAAEEADRLGLELGIASSPGFSETGGPWVQPRDGMKKLVWSETDIAGGQRFAGHLAAPPTVTGPFQSIPADPSRGLVLAAGSKIAGPPPYYADVKVLAYPAPNVAALPAATLTDAEEHVLDFASVNDGNLTTGVDLGHPAAGAQFLELTYPVAVSIQSATLFVPKTGGAALGPGLQPELQASLDGQTWSTVASIPVAAVPVTVSFPAVTARQFRVVFKTGNGTMRFAPPIAGVDVAAMAGASASRAFGQTSMRVTDFRLSSEARVDRVEAKAGFSIVPDYYALSKGLPDVAGIEAADVLDITDRLRPDGSLDWTPPPGRWRILRLGYSLTGTMNHPAPAEATGLEVDKFDGGAVQRYLDHYLGTYRATVGPGLIGSHGVRSLVTDSIEVGASNWTPAMIDQFRRLRGYDPTPWLPALTGTIIGSRSASDRFLYDFRRTLADLLASQHYGTVARVAHENGLKVYGEALEDQRPSLGDDMAMRSHTDVPMGAMWTYGRATGPKPTYLADLKGAASVAHIYGQNLVGAESLTSLLAPWAYGPADLKRMIDLEFALGVNRPVIHTSVHVPVDDKKPGLSFQMFGQQFNRNEAWAELARPWVDYIARNSVMLQAGRNVADVVYFYGEEAPLTGLYGTTPVPDAPRRHAYDFLNVDALLSVLAGDGDELVTRGGARYKALYLGGSSSRMTLPVLRKLAALVEGGATVIGNRPIANPGLADDAAEYARLCARLWPDGGAMAQFGKGRVIASSDVDAALEQAGVAADFSYTGGASDTDIRFVHRRLDDGDSYFLTNRNARPEKVEARFRVTGKAPELWHAETGTSEPVSFRMENGQTIVPLSLGADESVHVVFRHATLAHQFAVAVRAVREMSRIEGPWRVDFEAGRGAPANALMPELAPLNENADPGIRYFSGIATYEHDFSLPRSWRRGERLLIDLGEAKEVARVSVNGRLAGYAWHAPYLVDLSAAARPGRNHLRIQVANLWVDRLVGDAQPGATKVAWTATPTYLKNAPLRRSGLIGPVTLLQD